MILPRLEAKLGPGKEAGSDELNFCCPFCVDRKGSPDTKYHLYVNPKRLLYNIRGWFYCHRCHATGPISRLLSDSDGSPQHEVSKWGSFLENLKGSPEVTNDREVLLPEDYHPVVKNTNAYRYLKGRGLSDEIIQAYRIGFGTQSLKGLSKEERRKFAGSGRIIFPDYNLQGDLVYWVARTYVDHRVKYKNPPNSDARNKVYNLARASQYDTVIITEGVMSAIAAGCNGVATYGKDVTPAQVAMLAAVGFLKYIVALDGDALKHDPELASRKPRTRKTRRLPPALKLAADLYQRKCNVWVVRLPYWDDPDSADNFQGYVESAIKFDLKGSIELLLAASS